MELAFFRAEGETLTPLTLSTSRWSPDMMHGVATAGALGRALEQAASSAGRADLVPTKMSTDLFRPARMVPCSFETSVVREGSRLLLVDAVMKQDGEPVARSSAIFLKPSEAPAGAVWSPAEHPGPPPADLVPTSDDPDFPWLWSESVGWSQSFEQHANAERKQVWQTMVPVVLGESVTGFTAAAGLADSTNLVCNWGSEGVGYINSDVTLTLARLPISAEIGLSAVDHVAHAGLSVGTAAMFDRQGPLGTAVVTGLVNGRRSVTFTDASFEGGPSSPGV